MQAFHGHPKLTNGNNMFRKMWWAFVSIANHDAEKSLRTYRQIRPRLDALSRKEVNNSVNINYVSTTMSALQRPPRALN
eukprot:scaffold249173_cov22-Prasinocladus_malaysianus.AAC.1